MPLLSAQALSKRYGTRLAVDQVSFSLAPGESIGLLGPNGAGKTTILSLLTGLLKPDSGQVLIEGQAILNDADPRKRRLGLVPQEIALYEELSATDNLAFFGALLGLTHAALTTAIDTALDIVQLRDRRADRVKHFSGGMKRRLNLAVALLADPPVLLLDEPTVGVDPQSRNAIFENLHTLRQRGKALIYTTHYMEEVERLCDRVIILDHGRVLTDQSLTELRQTAGNSQQLALELAVEAEETAPWFGELRTLTDVHSVTLRGTQLLVTPHELTVGLAQVLQCLRRHGVVVTAVHSRTPRLEDIFLTLTGHSLRDSA